MTEPGTRSDLKSIRTTAVKDGDEYIINGSKTFISNGLNCDIVIVVHKTDANAGAKGMSLIVVEADRAGFRRGRKLKKVGQHAADTAELLFDNVRVPVSNRLGEEGRGFKYLMGVQSSAGPRLESAKSEPIRSLSYDDRQSPSYRHSGTVLLQISRTRE